jgi:hypothetical protein
MTKVTNSRQSFLIGANTSHLEGCIHFFGSLNIDTMSIHDNEEESSMSNMYSYQALQTSEDIRIRVLDPGQPSDEISCSLKRAFLPDHPHFEALSYVWGDPSDPRTVICSGERFKVTVNLYKALQHLRLNDSPRILWVDAICINQNDLQERGQQVGMMGTIYAQAEQVLVFLGEMTAEVERSLDQIA